MSKDLESPNLFNPMMLWTDLGMRALEATLSSSQNITDGVDRLARAGASPEANLEILTSSTHSSAPAEEAAASMAAPPGFAFVAQMQRTSFDLMTQGWRNWMNTLGALVSLGAGGTFGKTVVRQNPVLNAMREHMQLGHEAQAAITQAARTSRQQAGRQRERQADAMEHGHAGAEPKRRSRSSKAKPKARSRNS